MAHARAPVRIMSTDNCRLDSSAWSASRDGFATEAQVVSGSPARGVVALEFRSRRSNPTCQLVITGALGHIMKGGLSDAACLMFVIVARIPLRACNP
jgi:hypothetical protein